MSAYNESYLYDAMRNLADATDYAVYYKKMKIEKFYDCLIVSGVADRFANCNPKYIAGISGMELADLAIGKAGIKTADEIRQPYRQELNKSREYWVGWILTYWQWSSERSFEEMLAWVPAEKILQMYNPYHEADEQKFVDDVEKWIEEEEQKRPTKLAIKRNIIGLSQSELAKKSGVNIRSIQQYEQRTKDIRKASVETVMKLAKALYCKVENII